MATSPLSPLSPPLSAITTTAVSVLSPGILFFLIIVVGYLAQSLLLQIIFYYSRVSEVMTWKTQPRVKDGVGCIFFFFGSTTTTTSSSSSSKRQPYHTLFLTVNLFLAGAVAATTAELCVRGQCRMRDMNVTLAEIDVVELILATSGCILYESVTEYYWHRMMHLSFFYRHFHKYHHAYKAPHVFCDMYIHPLEALGYYFILYAPPFLFPINLPTFLLYMTIMGICGVMDHSGIKIRLATIYNAEDHDLHHSKFNVNYGFPFMFMDHLHDTYLNPTLGENSRTRPTTTTTTRTRTRTRTTIK